MVIRDTKSSDSSFETIILRLQSEVCDLLFFPRQLDEMKIALIITNHNMLIAIYIR